MIQFEYQYLNILRQILEKGVDRPDRTGVNSRSIWHASMQVNLAHGFPILTTRKVALRIAFEETWFFLRGETNTKKLEEKKINIWKGNTSREFLDSRGLHHLPEGDYGKAYGFQWRNFGGFPEFASPGIDQVVELIKGLQNDPYSRRHIISAWNPTQLGDMALPPCHLYQQYQILDGKLNSAFVMRSNDFLYGNPYNMMSYALLNHVFAKLLKLEPGVLGFTGMDVHLYQNQLDMAKEQLTRSYTALPELVIRKQINSIDDILEMEYSDLELIDYNPLPDFKNKPPMAI